MSWKNLLVKPVFGCIESQESPIAVLGVPLDHTGTYRPGTRFAPLRIREASCNIELYSLLANVVLEELGFMDYGDVLLSPGNLDRSISRIEYVVKNISMEHEDLLIILGGEHLLTYPSVKALRNKIDTLVVFDAHLDMRGEYLESSVNHATFLRKLIDENIKVLHLGSRAYSKDELGYLKNRDAEVYGIRDLWDRTPAIDDLGRVYISVDMDVFDPSIAPGVSNPEPYGIDTRMFSKLVNEIVERSKSIVAIDIVEVNPLFDNGDATSILAAKVAVEIAGLYLRKKETR